MNMRHFNTTPKIKNFFYNRAENRNTYLYKPFCFKYDMPKMYKNLNNNLKRLSRYKYM